MNSQRRSSAGFGIAVMALARTDRSTSALTTPGAIGTASTMGRPKQFDERIQLTLVEGTTAAIDTLLDQGEYRLDFIRTAIQAEISKRTLLRARRPKGTEPT